MAVSCFLRVRTGLERAAATDEPEAYVHDPAFQVISFFTVYGLPLLILLGLMLFATKRIKVLSNRSDVIQPIGLVSVLLDRTAPYGDRHDAAMDLVEFDEEIATAALSEIANSSEEADDLVEEATHSLVEIQRRKESAAE